jgi:LDH2 family malate/lactate/ureidoglycolate dehydrogenase
MIVLNIEAFLSPAEFNARMERLIAELKSVPPAKGFDEIFYPGEIEARNEERYLREGLHLREQTLADLAKLGRETGREAFLPF